MAAVHLHVTHTQAHTQACWLRVTVLLGFGLCLSLHTAAAPPSEGLCS